MKYTLDATLDPWFILLLFIMFCKKSNEDTDDDWNFTPCTFLD